MTGVRVHKSSMIEREAWFYDDTFLRGDGDECSLFVRHYVEYVTPKGHRHRRFQRDVLALPNEDAMAVWIEEHDAKESGDPDGLHRGWVPDGWEGAHP